MYAPGNYAQQQPQTGHPYAVNGVGPLVATSVVHMPAKSSPWAVPICDACNAEPGECCYAMMCPQCASYYQRKRLLAFTNEPHSCCQRYSLPSPGTCCDPTWQNPLERPMPKVWPPPPGQEPAILTDCHTSLCCEATFCPFLAMLGTRWLLQYKFVIHDDDCEKCVLCTGCGGGVCLHGPDGRSGGGNGGGLCFGCAMAQVTYEIKHQEAKYIKFLREKAAQPPPPQQQTMEMAPMQQQQQQQFYSPPPPQPQVQMQQPLQYPSPQQQQPMQYPQQQGQPIMYAQPVPVQPQYASQPQYAPQQQQQQQYMSSPSYGAGTTMPSSPPPAYAAAYSPGTGAYAPSPQHMQQQQQALLPHAHNPYAAPPGGPPQPYGAPAPQQFYS